MTARHSNTIAAQRFISTARRQMLKLEIALIKNVLTSRFSQNTRSFSQHGRKHHLSLPNLRQQTEKLLSIVENPVSASTKGIKISTDDCFDNLEAWMERAMYEKDKWEELKTAGRLLDALEHNQKADSSDTILVPSISFYEVTLHAYAISNGGRDSAIECEKILHRLIANCRSFRDEKSLWRVKPVAPTTKTFNICIDAWAKSTDREAGVRAEKLLALMEEWERECLVDKSFTGCAPSKITLVSVVNAWAKSRSSKAPDRSLEIITSLISDERSRLLLSPQLFNSTISIWARSGRGKVGADQCDLIVEMMRRVSSEYGLPLMPGTYTLAAQLDAWAAVEKKDRSGPAADRAEMLLLSAVECFRDAVGPKPNVVCFASCASARAWATRSSDLSRRCENIWDILVKLYKDSDSDDELRPDLHMGNIVLSAFLGTSNIRLNQHVHKQHEGSRHNKGNNRSNGESYCAHRC